MSSSFPPSFSGVSGAAHHVMENPSRQAAEMDDVAFGCECADPALQIDSWSQEAPAAAYAAGSQD